MTLICEVQYRALNSSDSIEVRWYTSRDEENAGREGEILNDVNKYQQSNGDPTPVNQTFIRQYLLGILRFSSCDRGYYWCRMVVNNVSLSPSPYGHIRSLCLLNDTICDIDQPFCAQDTHAQCMALKQVNGCSLIQFSNVSPTRSTFPVTDITTATMSGFATTKVASAIVAGIILLTFTIIIIVSSVIYVKKHRSESELIIHVNHIMYLVMCSYIR